MLRNVARNARPRERALKVGDFCRFPLSRLGDEAVYRYRWEVASLAADGSVTVRRLHDGLEKRIAAGWVVQYLADPAAEERPAPPENGELWARAVAEARAIDPERPEVPGHTFFVSVADGERRALLLGPYGTHREASRHVRRARKLACGRDPRSHWYAFGTASAPAGVVAETVFGR